MSSGGDGGSRVSIPADLRKTIQTIREITGKQHSDEDIFAVFNDCFNDPYETAQKLRYLDTFHEVRSKRDKKQENLVPNTQGSGRSGRRNYPSSYTYSDAGNGRSATFKREIGANPIKGGSRPAYSSPNKARNITVSQAIKTSDDPIPTRFPNGVATHKTQEDFTTTVNKQYAGQQPLCKSTSGSEGGVETDNPTASSDFVVQNHTQDALDENSARTSKPAMDDKPAEFQSSSMNEQDPLLSIPANCNGQSIQVIGRDAEADKSKTQLLLESDVGERPHVTFPVHIQVAKALENGLTFGSFDCNFMKETSSNNGSIEGDHLNAESPHGMGDNAGESSPTADDTPEEASSSQELSTFSLDKDNDGSNSAPGPQLVVSPVEGSKGDDVKEGLANAETHHIPSVQNVQQNVFGLVPSFPAPGQPINTGAVETQNAISKPDALSYSTPIDQSSIAASQQAIHLLRQQYPPNFFPYGPYFPPFYVPHPYIHQFLNPSGLPQQCYLPPGAAATAAPGIKVPFPQFKLGNNAGNPSPAPVPSPYGSSTVAFSHIPAATAVNSIHKEDLSVSQLKENIYATGPLSKNAMAWMAGQSLSNMQLSPMYNMAFQGQPFAIPPMQAGHGGFAGIYQPAQPVAAAPTADQTPQLSHTTPAMAETVGRPPMVYQEPQAAQPNWASHY